MNVTANSYGSGLLTLELAWFEQNRWLWFHQAEGKFALVKGETLFGFYENWIDAVREGIQRFPPRLNQHSPFLVKKILLKDEVFYI